jgi:hypothetical protein
MKRRVYGGRLSARWKRGTGSFGISGSDFTPYHQWSESFNSPLLSFRAPCFEYIGRHLHLHVISSDLIAPALKTKRHYNSFSPRTGFFIPLADVIHGWFDHEDDSALSQKNLSDQFIKVSLYTLLCMCGPPLPKIDVTSGAGSIRSTSQRGACLFSLR